MCDFSPGTMFYYIIYYRVTCRQTSVNAKNSFCRCWLAPFSPLRLRNINPISPCFLSLHTLLELLTPALSSSASRSPPVRFIPVFRAPIFPCSPLPLLSKNKYSEYFMCDLTLEDNFLIKPSRTNDRVTCRSDFGC